MHVNLHLDTYAQYNIAGFYISLWELKAVRQQCTNVFQILLICPSKVDLGDCSYDLYLSVTFYCPTPEKNNKKYDVMRD